MTNQESNDYVNNFNKNYNSTKNRILRFIEVALMFSVPFIVIFGALLVRSYC